MHAAARTPFKARHGRNKFVTHEDHFFHVGTLEHDVLA
jgi:hypothetical protein